MTSTELAAAFNYLTDAAHLLRGTAPGTSAHLMSQQASLLYHHDIAPSESRRQHICVACGHIMIPGIGSRLRLESKKVFKADQKKKKKMRRSSRDTTKTVKPAAGPVKIISCGFCSRATKVNLPIPDKVVRRKTGKTQARTQVDTIEKLAPPGATANASSKRRAKSRKAGLQALLSGQQQRPSASLSLADFIRK